MSIAQEIKALPDEVSRSGTLAEKVTELHLSQEQAVEVTASASKALFPETGGAVPGPEGSVWVLPKYTVQGKAMMVLPDGSVTVFTGDVTLFLK